MSLQRLAAGCVLAGFEGHEPPDWLRRALESGYPASAAQRDPELETLRGRDDVRRLLAHPA